jgi:hypothetical protein
VSPENVYKVFSTPSSSSRIITPSEITKASAIYSSFPIAVSPTTTDSFDAEAASAECLITMTAPPDNSAHASFWTVRDLLVKVSASE